MTYTFRSLEQGEIASRGNSMAAHVFNALRSAIVTLRLLPGDSLSEAEIAKQLKVSRQPVREAFIRLSKIGLLNIIPQRGTFVVKISERDVNNARFIREAIEVAIVQRACEMATKEHVRKIFRLIEDQESAASDSDQERFLQLDDAFHHAIARSADCSYGWYIVEDLKAQMDRVRFLSLPEATPLDRIISQHEEIAKAIETGDQHAAGNAMKMHLREILASLPKLAERHGDIFSKDPSVFH